MGNTVADISEALPMACWRHVKGSENPAHCDSRGIFLAELAEHNIWWEETVWLKETENGWNVKGEFEQHPVSSRERDIQRVLLPVIASNPPMLGKITVRANVWYFEKRINDSTFE